MRRPARVPLLNLPVALLATPAVRSFCTITNLESEMAGRYALSALSTVAFSAFANAGVPADPTITARAVLPRQNDAQFIGWVEYSGSC
jgi:hypothetical protein